MIKEIILMIMMTGGGEAPVDASFIQVDTREECEQRAANAIAVFPKAGIKYVGHHCAGSKFIFDDFLHNPEPTGPKYFFDLTFSGDGKQLTGVTSYAGLKECVAAGGHNCVIAYQNIQK
ncbi:MAG: hypothetical protein GXP00_01630 [Alphaproteobacteria bacterium]|nr:hypothetical protein [Alphaproteobacteria bacterium]